MISLYDQIFYTVLGIDPATVDPSATEAVNSFCISFGKAMLDLASMLGNEIYQLILQIISNI
ncbi:MAG: hypothetical protein K6B14_07235 [Lachnospiraceae bacterium]|nr:hypothetical protein [Lachnospiraceae bacterium]